jgi:hypothetical protein
MVSPLGPFKGVLLAVPPLHHPGVCSAARSAKDWTASQALLLSKAQVKELLHEAETMARVCNHSYVLDPVPCEVTLFCQNGSVENLILKSPNSAVPLPLLPLPLRRQLQGMCQMNSHHVASLKAPKKRGRPTTRETALERDEDLLSTHMLQKPHHYKGTPLYHPEYGLAAAYEAYIHMDKKPVWKVRFPNAPGGTQDYEMRQPEMERCLRAFKSQLSHSSQVMDPHQQKK